MFTHMGGILREDLVLLYVGSSDRSDYLHQVKNTESSTTGPVNAMLRTPTRCMEVSRNRDCEKMSSQHTCGMLWITLDWSETDVVRGLTASLGNSLISM